LAERGELAHARAPSMPTQNRSTKVLNLINIFGVGALGRIEKVLNSREEF